MHKLLALLTILVAGFLYRFGGADQWEKCPLKQKWWRWLMGLPIGFLMSLGVVSWGQVFINTILCGVTYYIATSAFKYGEKSWLNFAGERGKFTICGVAFGLAIFPVVTLPLAILQGIVSGAGFLAIKILDEKKIVQNPWVERLRGLIGTSLAIFS